MTELAKRAMGAREMNALTGGNNCCVCCPVFMREGT